MEQSGGRRRHRETVKPLRLGAGAGFAGDRIDPAAQLAASGEIDFLIFECLAERTIALAQQEKQKDASLGFDTLLAARLRAVLPFCVANNVKIITNMGAANPLGAAKLARQLADDMGFSSLKIIAITGDEVTQTVRETPYWLEELGLSTQDLGERLVAANAYLGAQPLVEALQAGAELIITGRVADPALFLAPLMYHFGWQADDYHRLGKGVCVGHMLECAGQLTGGYFADPPFKHVENLANLGFPYAIVDENGEATLTKLKGTGGQVTLATCKEQLLYEMTNPACYLQPDVTADFSQVTFTQLGKDRVRLAGANGQAAPEKLKVSVGYREGFMGEGQISYGGAGALARATLANEILSARLKILGLTPLRLKIDYIGVNSLFGGEEMLQHESSEVRLRAVAQFETLNEATRFAQEVETLYTNGPAGGGGVTKSTRPVLAIASCFMEREKVKPMLHVV